MKEELCVRRATDEAARIREIENFGSSSMYDCCSTSSTQYWQSIDAPITPSHKSNAGVFATLLKELFIPQTHTHTRTHTHTHTHMSLAHLHTGRRIQFELIRTSSDRTEPNCQKFRRALYKAMLAPMKYRGRGSTRLSVSVEGMSAKIFDTIVVPHGKVESDGKKQKVVTVQQSDLSEVLGSSPYITCRYGGNCVCVCVFIIIKNQYSGYIECGDIEKALHCEILLTKRIN